MSIDYLINYIIVIDYTKTKIEIIVIVIVIVVAKFHHDNAKLHVAECVKSYLNSNGFTIIRHPPYSPDLAPSDFWLFDYIKRQLTDHTNRKSLEKEITETPQKIRKEERLKTFNK